MIIVSQDKATIVNFNNISIITQVDGRIGVTNNATNSTVSEIGVYETEKRAKEVLQEIKYKYAEYVELSSSRTGIEGIYAIPKVYEMPED